MSSGFTATAEDVPNGRTFDWMHASGNLVIGNRVGAHVWAGSIHNEVDGNDFIQNRDQVRYVASHDEAWGVKQGNYWSNYAGWDADGDGIGDGAGLGDRHAAKTDDEKAGDRSAQIGPGTGGGDRACSWRW
jgi:hypothetical protein